MIDRIKDRLLELEERLGKEPKRTGKYADYHNIQGQIEGLTFALDHEVLRTPREAANQLAYDIRTNYSRVTKGDFGNYYRITKDTRNHIGGKLLIKQTGIDSFLEQFEVKVEKEVEA